MTTKKYTEEEIRAFSNFSLSDNPSDIDVWIVNELVSKQRPVVVIGQMLLQLLEEKKELEEARETIARRLDEWAPDE